MLSTSAWTACTGSMVVTWLAYTTVSAVELALEPVPDAAVLLPLLPPQAATRTTGRQAAAARTGLRRRAFRSSGNLIGGLRGRGGLPNAPRFRGTPFGIPKSGGRSFHPCFVPVNCTSLDNLVYHNERSGQPG